jgi:hypothetical protein
MVLAELEAPLADRLALALLDQGVMPCERLARVVAVRTSTVRDVLRADPRFERVGVTRGSRWRLVLPLDSVMDGRDNGHVRPSDGMGRNLGVGGTSTDGLDVAARLDALERRLGLIERHLAHTEAPAA